MQVMPYLFFSGECEDALNFYRSVFGGDIVSINRYAGSPMEQQAPPGCARLSVGTGDHDEGQRVFDGLAAGGTVTLPYEKQFWGSSFGMLVDRFGLEWMINAG